MSSISAPFYNITDGNQEAKQQAFNFQGELVDLLTRYAKYIGNGIDPNVIKRLRGGATTVSNSSGTLTVTLAPAATTPNPNPLA